MDNERFEHENDFKGLDLTDTTESFEQEDEPAGSDENDASDLSDTYEYHDGPAGQDLNDPADPVKPAESVSVLDADRADTADRNASGFAADRADTTDRKTSGFAAGSADSEHQNASGTGSGRYYSLHHAEESGRYSSGRRKKDKKGIKWLAVALAVILVFVLGAGAGAMMSGRAATASLPESSASAKNSVESSAEEEEEKTPSRESGSGGETISRVKDQTSDSSLSDTTVADVAEKVMPAIVSVYNKYTEKSQFFGRTYTQEAESAGSGIIIEETDNELLIVTNNHVVEGADSLSVQFINEENCEAALKGTDPSSDLAVISVSLDSLNEDTKKQIAIAELGDSDSLRIGEHAIAIGNAMGYGLSVTEGIISALNRQMSTGLGIHSFIQTDASINYGNYGGALLNAQGEVIGINAGKISRDSGEGMGYAFPINSAKDAITEMIGTASGSSAEVQEEQTEEAPQKETESKPENQVMLQVADPETEETKESEAAPETEEKETQPEEEKSEESISKPSSGGTLGVSVGEVSDEYSIIYRIPKGAYIMEVMDGSGAQKAGLREDDVIVRINDTDITSVMELKDALASTKPGDKVKVTYLRPDGNGDYDSDRTSNVTVTLQ